MESYDYTDNIKAEKANAIARYRMFTNITKLFQIIEVFVAVAVISWSSAHLPHVLKLSGEYMTSLSSYFVNQHVVFLLGNLIVLVCYVMSRYSDSDNDDRELSRFTHRKISSDDPMTSSEARNPMIRSENSVTLQAMTSSEVRNSNEKSFVKTAMTSSEIQNPVNRNEKTVTKPVKLVTVEMEMTPEKKRMERFQRTRSEKVRSEIPVESRRELRRSVTEMRRNVAVGKEAVEKLSNEEFRVRVEMFILKQQRFLKEQSMVEVEDDSY